MIDGMSDSGGDSNLGTDTGGGGGDSSGFGGSLGGLGGGGGGKGGGGYSAQSTAKSGAQGGTIGPVIQDLGFSTGAGIRGFNNVVNFSGAQTEAQSYINPVTHGESLGGGLTGSGMGTWGIIAGVALLVVLLIFRHR